MTAPRDPGIPGHARGSRQLLSEAGQVGGSAEGLLWENLELKEICLALGQEWGPHRVLDATLTSPGSPACPTFTLTWTMEEAPAPKPVAPDLLHQGEDSACSLLTPA